MNRYLYDFQILEFTAFHREAHERAYLLPSCQSGRSRVDVKEIQARVELHLQDVGMPADEKPGRALLHYKYFIAVPPPARHRCKPP